MNDDITELFRSTHVKHCSLDFWNTIGLSNPRFKDARNSLVASVTAAAPDNVGSAFGEIGKWYNDMQETGQQYMQPEELLKKVIVKLGAQNAEDVNIKYIYQQVCDLFKEYPPRPTRFAEHIVRQCHDYGITLSIMSNTAFVPGCLIRAFLERQYSADVFSFELYSDEVHLAKPQLAMYDMCFAQVQLIHGDAVLRQNVLHAGDSLVNDVQAGIIAGMRTYAVYE